MLPEEQISSSKRSYKTFFVGPLTLTPLLKGASIVFITAIFTMVLRNNIPPELAGLALSFSFQMTTNMQRAVKLYGECENNMTSYERLLYYANELDQEAPAVLDFRPADDWPQKG